MNPDIWAEDTQKLNVPCGGQHHHPGAQPVTCQMGVSLRERGDRDRLRFWFAITFVMGLIFIAGQVFEYPELLHEGLSFSGPLRFRRSSSPPASTACT